MIKTILKLFLFCVLAFLLYLGGVIAYGTLTDYQPKETLPIEVQNNPSPMAEDSIFTFMIWNIGYSGLGEKSDFFYDGGKMVRSNEEDVFAYFQKIQNLIKSNDSIDFILLQEVDQKAYRSYHISEIDSISNDLKATHGFSFATNYKAPFVPLPITNPMRDVHGGLLSLFQFNSSKATREGFVKENFEWPKKVFFLDRCMLENRFNLKNGKQLVVYNTHFSAYDATGKLKQAEMSRMKELITKEFEKGNYVIVGGDWNQLPPNFDNKKFSNSTDQDPPQGIDSKFLDSNWTFVYDPEHPTNRDLSTTFTKNKTGTTLIDYFLVSNNLNVQKIKTENIDFNCSDHQPVILQVQLKN